MHNQEDIKRIWQEYEEGVAYKQRIDLYETVKQNENFFVGKQWEGVEAPDLDKPVLNILGRVVGYLISVLVGERVGVSAELFNTLPDDNSQLITQIIDAQIKQSFEHNAIMSMARELVRNCAVDGDCCMHLYFDPYAPTNQAARGLVKAEIVENTNVFFGNPTLADKERQPYIILSARKLVEQVKEEMALRGATAEEIAKVQPDSDRAGRSYGLDEAQQVTVLCKYYRVGESIWVTKTTRNAVVMPAVNTGYRLYPIAYMSWEKIKNSYHGQAVLTGLIPNQIAINKLMAMAIKYQKEMAFPKILFDRTKIDRWSNQIGAIGVNGDPTTAIFRGVQAPEMSAQVMMLIDRLIGYTRDLIGASDAALGTIRPDNASAVVTVTKNTAVPLALQKRSLYQFYEDVVRSLLDIIRCDYGTREIVVQGESPRLCSFDFATLDNYLLKLGIDTGAGSFYSELDQIQTLDRLFSRGIIKDAVAYLEAIPAGYLPNKNALIASVKAQDAKEQRQPSEEPSM